LERPIRPKEKVLGMGPRKADKRNGLQKVHILFEDMADGNGSLWLLLSVMVGHGFLWG
jgi:hypothetical protein